MSNYQTDLEQAEAVIAAKQFENDCRSGFLGILHYYGLNDHQANFNAVRDYCSPFPITLAGYKQMLENPQAAASLDLGDDTKAMVNEIIYLLSNFGTYSKIDLKIERDKTRYKTKSEIRERLAEIKEKQRLHKLSADQIRTELRASRPVTTQATKVLPVEITRAAIHAMPSPQIRKLIRDYSASAVNDRLFSRS
jgi:hypothetical protein